MICALFFAVKLWQTKQSLSVMKEALEDIKAGNLNRRVLAKENDMTKQICHDINMIVLNNQTQFIRQQQSEASYKRLMTSLSHDAKTPLASLVGYLEAVTGGLVTGEEKEAYIRIASEKAHQLKGFIESLFEWVKLDAGEQTYHFEQLDLNELTRSIIADWIPTWESSHFKYEIEIPETEYWMDIDIHAYTRILNNLFQNILKHSDGNKLTLRITEEESLAQIEVSDNGIGILPSSLPHIFERMYQCDDSRLADGNGLGLAIVKELVSAHKGKIKAESTPSAGITFTITFRKAL
jgi:signal transduction histidine kinase